jgi:PKHD-type hydroxylase
MFISHIHNILDADKLGKSQKLIDSARFVDGRISGGTERDKKNLELAPETDRYVDVLNIVEAAVRENMEFNLTAFPRFMTRPIISRYEVGMFYKEHVDLPVMGFMSGGKPANRGLSPVGANYVRSDLSMTLFLAPPESYTGGELCFESPTHVIRTKLPAGSAVLYPTGARHSVAEVTQGVRVAAIFWIQTMFPVEGERRAICDSHRLVSLLGKNPDAPEFLLAQDSFYNLCRMFASV